MNWAKWAKLIRLTPSANILHKTSNDFVGKIPPLHCRYITVFVVVFCFVWLCLISCRLFWSTTTVCTKRCAKCVCMCFMTLIDWSYTDERLARHPASGAIGGRGVPQGVPARHQESGERGCSFCPAGLVVRGLLSICKALLLLLSRIFFFYPWYARWIITYAELDGIIADSWYFFSSFFLTILLGLCIGSI